jgi:hypothetical protein
MIRTIATIAFVIAIAALAPLPLVAMSTQCAHSTSIVCVLR